MNPKVTLKATADGNFIEPETGAPFIRLPGDTFANSTTDCAVCEEDVTAGEDCYLCPDGGDTIHIDCAVLVE